LANAIARRILIKTKGLKPTEVEVKRNVQLAKDTAKDAVSRLECGAGRSCYEIFEEAANLLPHLIQQPTADLIDENNESGGIHSPALAVRYVSPVEGGLNSVQATEYAMLLISNWAMHIVSGLTISIPSKTSKSDSRKGRHGDLPFANEITTLPRTGNVQSPQPERAMNENEGGIACETTAQASSSMEGVSYITKWKCDFCHVAKFDTHEGASRHEETCAQRMHEEISNIPINASKRVGESPGKNQSCSISENGHPDPGTPDIISVAASQQTSAYIPGTFLPWYSPPTVENIVWNKKDDMPPLPQKNCTSQTNVSQRGVGRHRCHLLSGQRQSPLPSSHFHQSYYCQQVLTKTNDTPLPTAGSSPQCVQACTYSEKKRQDQLQAHQMCMDMLARQRTLNTRGGMAANNKEV